MEFLNHLFRWAEVYTIGLTLVIIPMVFLSVWNQFKKDVPDSSEVEKTGTEGVNHETN